MCPSAQTLSCFTSVSERKLMINLLALLQAMISKCLPPYMVHLDDKHIWILIKCFSFLSKKKKPYELNSHWSMTQLRWFFFSDGFNNWCNSSGQLEIFIVILSIFITFMVLPEACKKDLPFWLCSVTQQVISQKKSNYFPHWALPFISNKADSIIIRGVSCPFRVL